MRWQGFPVATFIGDGVSGFRNYSLRLLSVISVYKFTAKLQAVGWSR
jgi:hypothetical protein